MKQTKLDRLDREILRKLQSNGRMTNTELAQQLGLSPPPCLRRLRGLEESGYIKGYYANLNAEVLGYGMTVFVQVGLSHHGKEELEKFKELVDQWPQVRESYMMTGDADYLLKVVAKDWDDYQRFLTTKLTAAPNVEHVKSALTVGTTKFTPGIPVDEE